MRAKVRLVWMGNMRFGEKVSTTMIMNPSEYAPSTGRYVSLRSNQEMRTQKTIPIDRRKILYMFIRTNPQNPWNGIDILHEVSKRV